MADDTDGLDGIEDDEKAPPIRPRSADMTGEEYPPVTPIHSMTPPVAPNVTSAAPPPVIPVAQPKPPSLGQAILNTLGNRPDPNAPQYQPIQHSRTADIMNRIGAAGAGFRSPETAMAIR